MSDYISRQATLDAVKHAWAKGIEPSQYIESIKPADVVPVVHGKWINGRCNKCGEHAPFWAMASTYYTSNFCPNCGADMRGEQDG